MKQKALLTLMMFLTFYGLVNAKRAGGYYITTQGDTVKAVFGFEESNTALGIFRIEGKKKILLEPAKVKMVVMDLDNRKLKFVSKKDVVKYYDTTNGFLKTIERKDILPGDTIHQHPVFMQIFDDTGLITFGLLSYYYNGTKYNDLVLQKGNESLYYFKSESIKKQMLAYFYDCSEVRQQIINTPKEHPPIEEFVLSLLKTYNAKCMPKVIPSAQ